MSLSDRQRLSVFFNAEQEGFTYDRKALLSRLEGIDVRFLTKGFSVGTRPVRFGIPALLKELRPDLVFVHEYSSVRVELSLLSLPHFCVSIHCSFLSPRLAVRSAYLL